MSGADVRAAKPSSFYTAFSGGVVLTVKVKPGTSKTRAMKVVDIGDGRKALEIAVSAPPEDGKANKAVCDVLSKTLGVSRAALTIKAGQTGRVKRIEAQGVRAEDIEKRDLFT